MFRKKYHKVVELPTGLTTKIADTLEGSIEVSAPETRVAFDYPIHYRVTCLFLPDRDYAGQTSIVEEVIVEAPDEEAAAIAAKNKYAIQSVLNIKLLR